MTKKKGKIDLQDFPNLGLLFPDYYLLTSKLTCKALIHSHNLLCQSHKERLKKQDLK